jgi:hypothetical protein
MKLTRYIPASFFAALALLSAGCRDDMPAPVYNDSSVSGHYFIIGTTESKSDSRVSYLDEHHSEFETGDVIGAFTFDAEDDGNVVQANVPMQVVVTENFTDDGGNSVVIKALEPVSEDNDLQKGAPRYLFYYPYDAEMTLDRLKNYSHTVEQEQSFGDSEFGIDNYGRSDFIWDYVTPDADGKSCHIVFEHLMANIVVLVSVQDVRNYESATIFGQPVTLTGANLLEEDLDNVNYTVAEDQEVFALTQPNSLESSDAHAQTFFFRVAVPACRDLKASDEPFLRITRKNTAALEFRLKQDVALRPGHNYYFNISDDTPPIIDITDEDSWVLEVFSPDGKLVGYLCREYIYYADPSISGASEYRDASPTDPDKQFEAAGDNLGVGISGYMLNTNPGTDDLYKQMVSLTEKYRPGGSMAPTAGNLAINSQVWVFYNLIPGQRKPDLTKGTVLRFVYDMKSGGGYPGYTPIRYPEYAYDIHGNYPVKTNAAWPQPHAGDSESVMRQGIYKVDHGHEYLNSFVDAGREDVQYATDAANSFGFSSPHFFEYYMHGGTLYWDPAKNIVDEFVMPQDETGEPLRITNTEAYLNGHIAYDSNGQAFVSYTPAVDDETDMDGNGICYVVEKTVTVGNRAYPLRKVGFNQFWFAKSLRCFKDAKGRTLLNYNLDLAKYREVYGTEEGYTVGMVDYQPFRNSERKPHEKFGKDELLAPGYVIPTAKGGDPFYGNTEGSFDGDFDPVNNPDDRENLAYLYNLTNIADGTLIPTDKSGFDDCRIPTWKDMVALRRYGGYLFAAKWISDNVRKGGAGKVWLETTVDALRGGKLISGDSYCANISGLDFRGFGCQFLSEPGFNDNATGIGQVTYFFINPWKDNLLTSAADLNAAKNKPTTLNRSDMNFAEVFKLNTWDCWGSNPMKNYHQAFYNHTEFNENTPQVLSRLFAPVRIVCSFDNPIGPGRSMVSRFAGAPTQAQAIRATRLDLEPVKK